MSDVDEKAIAAINASLKEVGDQLKANAEQAIKDQAANKEMNDGMKKSIDSLLTEQASLKAKLQDAEQAIVAASNGGGKEKVLSLGQQVAASEDLEGFNGGTVRIGINAAITGGDGSNVLVERDRLSGIVPQGQRRLTIRDLLAQGTTESNSVEYTREDSFTNNAAETAENTAKPESDITFSLQNAPVATIAHWIPASKQVLSDNGMLSSYIDARLTYGVKVREEDQILKGDGTGVNLNGIFTQASAYALPSGGNAPTQSIDIIRMAILQAELEDYFVDGVVLNHVDWANMETLKDADGNYLFGNPHTPIPPMVWGRSVVPTKGLDADEFLVGAFGSAAQVFDREEVSVEISTENQDNFIKNMCTIRAEERIALAVYRPNAFVKGSLTIAP